MTEIRTERIYLTFNTAQKLRFVCELRDESPLLIDGMVETIVKDYLDLHYTELTEIFKEASKARKKIISDARKKFKDSSHAETDAKAAPARAGKVPSKD